LSVHHKNIGMFMSHDLKAHAFLPRSALVTRVARHKFLRSKVLKHSADALRSGDLDATCPVHSIALRQNQQDSACKRAANCAVILEPRICDIHNPGDCVENTTVRGNWRGGVAARAASLLAAPAHSGNGGETCSELSLSPPARGPVDFLERVRQGHARPVPPRICECRPRSLPTNGSRSQRYSRRPNLTAATPVQMPRCGPALG